MFYIDFAYGLTKQHWFIIGFAVGPTKKNGLAWVLFKSKQTTWFYNSVPSNFVKQETLALYTKQTRTPGTPRDIILRTEN